MIDSALNQVYRNTQVIVVGDGSTEDSREIIAGCGGRIIAVLCLLVFLLPLLALSNVSELGGCHGSAWTGNSTTSSKVMASLTYFLPWHWLLLCSPRNGTGSGHGTGFPNGSHLRCAAAAQA